MEFHPACMALGLCLAAAIARLVLRRVQTRWQIASWWIAAIAWAATRDGIGMVDAAALALAPAVGATVVKWSIEGFNIR